ncbi:MAG: hypothetical protein K8F36_03110 [Melioribacteraceae bacterium]|nr:hypothetical protein [Melioribacteraceae bacterium]MCO6472365.1 hypothetical protein [Melioribacteraceae bacterium]MDD3559725.1 hypothetical protein [Melioribacteraceae bacterium]
MVNRILFIILNVILAVNLSAQNSGRVEKFIIDGTLKASDPISAELGRINAVQLNFSKGDRFYSHLEAEFVPMLVLVPPSGEYIVKYPDPETLTAVFDDRINESGQWLLYIVGDSSDTGSYTLTNKYASEGALNFSQNDFCNVLDKLMLHLKADFHFIKGKVVEQDVEWGSKIKLQNSVSSRIYGVNNSWFNAILFEGESKESALEKFDSANLAIKNCLSNFTISEKKWKSIIGAEGKREKSTTYWSNSDPGSFLKLSVYETPKQESAENFYSVQIFINKER